MSTKYKIQPLNVNDVLVPTVVQGTRGCPNLVALHNIVCINYCSSPQQSGTLKESGMKSVLSDLLQKCIEQVQGISDANIKNAKDVLANLRSKFSLQPRLSAHTDFVMNGSYLLCHLLKLPVLHGWVINPEVSSYDSLKEFSHNELVDYSMEAGKDDHLCQSLLDDSKVQLTSYGFESLSAELNDDGIALLFCCNRLEIIHKHNDALFIYVSSEDIRTQMPQAVWMLFEEHQESNIYFTEMYTPVRGQQHTEKAMEWYMRLLQQQHNNNQACQSQASWGRLELKPNKHSLTNKLLQTQRKVDEPKEDKGKEKNKSSQEGQSDDAALESLEPSEATGAVGSHHSGCPQKVKKLPQYEQSVDVAAESSESSATTGILTTGNEGEDKSDKPTAKDDKRAEAVASHHSEGSSSHEAKREVVVSHQDTKVEKLPEQEQFVDAAAESSEGSATTGILTTGNEEDKSDKSTLEDDKRGEAVGSVSQDGVPEGDASVFLNFLDQFKDNGCSEYYFKGIVAAFAKQKPLFYVLYDFIMAYNELLALKIQDNYSRISEDLNKAAVFYLSKNGVDFPDAKVKIIGLPAPKSVQHFLDFLDTIVLHDHYAIYDEHPQALPSYDSRRMGLGYLGCIVAKFKTGRSWAGKWSVDNMKVKNNGTLFVIELEEDYELDSDVGYLDLQRFCEIVLTRLKYDGQFLPYFDELAEDHMLITECFGNSEKWPRFLEFISYPLALKPPLVRAALICNVYIAGDANSSGDPPVYSPLSSRKNCIDWRRAAYKHQLLRQVYEYQNDRKIRKFKYLIDSWSPKHWHVFKFSRHFIQHVLGYTKGKDLIQRIKDISVIDILLSRTMSKAIAISVRFLVLNCGVDGLFSSAWRHYVGSDYIDKPNSNLEDATTGDMVQELVDSISEEKITGYVYSEISAYSESQHVSFIMIDADLIELQKFLNGNNFKFELNGDRLKCGSIILWKRSDPPTKESAERTVIVVEGPYSAEYDSVYVLLTEFMGLPPTM